MNRAGSSAWCRSVVEFAAAGAVRGVVCPAKAAEWKRCCISVRQCEAKVRVESLISVLAKMVPKCFQSDFSFEMGRKRRGIGAEFAQNLHWYANEVSLFGR